LITAAAVKKVYRKATLCIHPDKVQQKGANLQQKYIAEKVFDLLKVCIASKHLQQLLFSNQYDNVVYPCFSEPMHHGINCQGIKKLVLFLSM